MRILQLSKVTLTAFISMFHWLMNTFDQHLSERHVHHESKHLQYLYTFTRFINQWQHIDFQQVTWQKWMRWNRVFADTNQNPHSHSTKLQCDGARVGAFVMALTSIHFCASWNAESAAESVTGWCSWDGPMSAAGLAIEQKALLRAYWRLSKCWEAAERCVNPPQIVGSRADQLALGWGAGSASRVSLLFEVWTQTQES